VAKELPYFKFEPSEWDSGNIQMCSHQNKGLFIDLCSLYWLRLGELPYALALQKLCNGNEDALQELKNHQIIGVIDGQILIEFLDEQLTEFKEINEKRRNSANKRWLDASALQVESKSNAKREEEKREEKTRGDKTRVSDFDFDKIFEKAFDELTCDTYKLPFKHLNLPVELEQFKLKCQSDKDDYYHRGAAGLRKAFLYQLRNSRNKNNGKGTFTDKRTENLRGLAEDFAKRHGSKSS